MKRVTQTLPTLVAVLLFVLLPIGVAQATPAAPAWSIVAQPEPTTFEAGAVYEPKQEIPSYQLFAFNVGGAATTSEFTITDTLPKGLSPAPGVAPTSTDGRRPNGGEFRRLTCGVLGRKITCTGGSVPVGPGEEVSLKVPVEVEKTAVGVLVDRASIQGGGALAAANTEQPTTITSSATPFGFLPQPGGLYGLIDEPDGSPSTRAGSSPYTMTVAGMSLTTNRSASAALLAAGGGVRELSVEVPHGIVINPTAVAQCKESELENLKVGCPDASQVGTVTLGVSLSAGASLGNGAEINALYNMVPPPGYPAELAFEVLEGTYVHLLGGVRSDGSFTLTAASKEILAKATIGSVRTTLWGVPSDESHDQQRGECAYQVRHRETCPTTRTEKPFLTMPSACSGPLTTIVHAISWLGETAEGSYETTDLKGHPVGVEGCSALEFNPSIEAGLTTSQGEAPSGLDFHLRQAQHESARELATANLKNATITLPAGVAVNPSASNGLEACSSAQVGLASAVGATPVRFHEGSAHCPDASKLGTVDVTTPLLKEGPEGERLPRVLKGGVYLAKQYDNPFGSLLALYLVVEDEQTGVIAKLAGRVEPDPQTGQLTTTFDENPELPLEDVALHLFGGDHGALTTPVQCGEHAVTSTLVPWSTPEGADAHPTSALQTTGSCVASESAVPQSVSFSAGTTSTAAGAYSPFVMQLSRPDGSQRLGALNLTLPQGLVGKIAGIPYCSEAQISQAAVRDKPEEGKLEQQSPSCPASSEVGTVTVGAGSGPDPVYVTGHAYLAGPYKGAPFSLAIVTPAIAGPFDLGVVVVRAGLYIDPNTSQVTVKSDPLPTILDGIPLDVRSVAVSVNRSQFTFNPTSCETLTITGQAVSTTGSVAGLSNRFQVGGCENLKFKPSFTASTAAKTSRKNGASLHVKLSYPIAVFGTQANIKSVHVELPKALPSRLNTLNHACTDAVFKQNPANCPTQSRVGTARATTPVLPVALEGPAYFVSHGGAKFPELITVLQGDNVTIDLAGETFISKTGITSSTFNQVPDVPVGTFELDLPQGEYSALAANTNLCQSNLAMPTVFDAQNGLRVEQSTPIEVQGCPNTLTVVTRKTKGRTLTLTISVPSAGKLAANGKGITTAAAITKTRRTVTIKLKERQTGPLTTNVLLRFTPNTGKQRKVLRKTLQVTFR